MPIGEWILGALSREPVAGASAHGSVSYAPGKELALLRREYPGLSALVRGKRVVDFGCGTGEQAVALARTMLVNPRVLFLDEPSSSMDLATERQLIGHLSQSLEDDHTVLIATHRFSLLKLVSRIIVLDNGRIAADGERDAVLAQLKVSIGDQG